MGGGGSQDARGKYQEQTKALCKAAMRDTETVQDFEDQVIRSFEDWDVDGNGILTVDELAVVFSDIGLKMSKKELKEMLKDMDSNNDGGIDYQEMVAYLFRAPFLERYFEESKAILSGAVGEPPKSITEEQSNLIQELIRNSFAFHDKDASGILEKDESIIFLSNYAALLPQLHLHVISKVGSEDAQKKAQADFDAWIADLKEGNRFNNKVQEAFKRLDVSGDGRLQIEEIVAALTHGSEKNLALMGALDIPLCIDMEKLKC